MRYKVQVINAHGAERYKHCGITAGMRVSGVRPGETHMGPYYVFNEDRFYPMVELEPHEFDEVHDFMSAQGAPLIYHNAHLPYNFASLSPIPSGGEGTCVVPIASGIYQTAMDENSMIGKNLMQRHAMMYAYQKHFTETADMNMLMPVLYSTTGRRRLTKAGAKRLEEFGAKENMWVGIYRRDKNLPTPLVPSSDKTYTFVFDQGLMIRCHFRLNDEDTYISFEEPDIVITAPLISVFYIDKNATEITVTRSTVFRPFYDYPYNVFVFEASVPTMSSAALAFATERSHEESKWNLSTIPQFVDIYYADGRPLGEWYSLPKPDWMQR